MKKRNGFSTPLSLQIGLALMIVCVFFTGYNLAKYVAEDINTNALSAKSFYFESDLLDGTTYMLPVGIGQLDISLMNYADELRTSEVDISYALTLYKNDVKVGSYPKNNVLPLDAQDGIVVESLPLSGAGTYRVEVNATGPYTKALPATTFVVPENDADLEWRVEDGEGSAVCYLVISAGEYTGSISVTTPAAVHINPNEEVPTTVSAYTEYRLTYFKDTITEVYDEMDFTVTKN